MIAAQTFRALRSGRSAAGFTIVFAVRAACLSVAALAVACGGSSTIKAASDWERGVDLAPTKTFSVARSPALPSDLTPDQARLVALVDETIKGELARKGYREAAPEAAELVLMSNFSSRERSRVGSHACADYAGFTSHQGSVAPTGARASCQQATITNFAESTLLIDVYDGRSRQLVWHGWATGEKPKAGAEDTPALVKQATLDILERFPP
jgi:hypothetical protein